MAPTTTPTRMTAWLEQAWLVQYLDRQLAGEEAQWFEAYAMDRPELLATIEADTRLRDALVAAASIRHTDMSVDGGGRRGAATDVADARGSNEASNTQMGCTDFAASKRDDAAPTRTTRVRPRSQSSLHRWHTAPTWLAMAASLLIGLGVGSNGIHPRDGESAPLVIASPTRIIYDTMRGETTLPRVEHAESKSPYVLIEISVPLSAERITLKIGEATEQALTRSPDGFVTFLADRKTLAATADAQVSYIAGGRTQTRPLSLQSKRSLR